jgi:hypothetical protein
MVSREQIDRLAVRRQCPRCSLEKTAGMALCRRCRYKLPTHMRQGLEFIERRETRLVSNALRAAADYFDIRYKSILHFGGGRSRDDE